MRAVVALALLAVAVGACGRADDLTVALVPDPHGAPLDTSPPVVSPQTPSKAPTAGPTEAPTEGSNEGPTDDTPTEIVLGDVPTSADAPVAAPVPAEPGPAASDAEAADDEVWTPPPIEPPKLVDGEWRVNFDYLGTFDVAIEALPVGSPLGEHTPRPALPTKPSATDAVPLRAAPAGLPEVVKKLDGQTVRIEGYMIPLQFERGTVKTFFLSRYMMGCCFGVIPKATEVMEVTMAEGAKAYYDAYMRFVVIGKLEVVEEGTDPDFLKSVFRMQADSCDYSEDW